MTDFVATTTQGDFMNSPAYIRLLAGPVGGGKSVTCSHELLRLACEQAPDKRNRRRTRMLIVRNTADQLKQTTMKTVFDWFPPGEAGIWKAQDKTFLIRARLPDGTVVESEWLFLALDTPDDVRRALSLEVTFVWGNECRELHPDVIDGLLARVNRYPSMKDGGATRAGAIFDTNMPDLDTWWQDKMDNPPSNWSIHIQPPAILSKAAYVERYNEEPETVIEGSGDEVWAINPEADNLAHLHPTYYPNIIPGKTEDWLRVYLRSEFGRSLAGRPVYDKSFNPDWHIATDRLRVTRAESYPVIIGQDFGRTPAAVFMQRDPRGRIVTLAELVSENMGIETFITEKLTPFVQTHFAGCELIVAPDPAGWAKQQANEMSLVDILKAAGYYCIRLVSNDPDVRIAAVERLLRTNVGAGPGFLVDDVSCPTLARGFRHGYRYKMKKSGDFEDKPEKNYYSHVHDAAQYAAMAMDMNLRGRVLRPTRKEVKPASYVYT